MQKLKGNNIYLRALEPQDLDFLFLLENDEAIWEVSGTLTPYSKHVLGHYLENAHRDIFDVKQLRLAICEESSKVVGLIDLFDFDPKHRRAGLGIVVLQSENRNRGIGAEAVDLLMKYAFQTLDLHQLYVNVGADNEASLYLFQKLGFLQVGVKKDWIYSNGGYKDELLFQKINL